MKKKIIVGFVLLATALAFMILGAINKDSGESPQETNATEAAAPAPQTSTGSAQFQDPNLPSPVPQTEHDAITAAVQGFIFARSGQRWDDSSATAWVDRAVHFTTDGYAAQLQATYPSGAGGTAWQQLVQERIIREARIDSLQVVQAQDLSKGSVTVLARYRISQAIDGQQAETFEPFNKLVMVVLVNGQWRIDSMNEVTGGSVPERPTPALSPSNPPKVSEE